MIRAVILQNHRKFDVTGDDREIKQAVLRLWHEYLMHTEQGISYKDMGYVLDGGQVPAWKIDEHMLIHGIASQARNERQRREANKAKRRRKA